MSHHRITDFLVACYSSDPKVFSDDLLIPTSDGPRQFRAIKTEFQVKVLDVLAEPLVALAHGRAPHFKLWSEAVKGSAKTTLLGIAVSWLLSFSRVPQRIDIGAGDQGQASEVRQVVDDLVRLNDWLGSRIRTDRWQAKCEATDSIASILTTQAETTEGSRPTLCVLDELTHIRSEAFWQAALDNGSKTGAMVWITTNAGFQGTPAWTLRELARTSPRWQFIQSVDTPPQIDAAELEEARRRNPPARFARLFEGVWASGSGDVIDETDLAAAVDDKLGPMRGDEQGFAFLLGCDLGIRHDHSAICCVAVHVRSQRIRLAYCRSWAPSRITGKVDLEEVEAELVATAKRFGAPVFYDPFQCELLAQRATRMGVRMVPVPFTPPNCTRMASDLLDTFRSQRIDLYPDKLLLRDLRRLTIVERPNGSFKLESTRDADGHADRATALSLALQGLPEALCRSVGPWGTREFSERLLLSQGEHVGHLARMYGEPARDPANPFSAAARF